VEVPPKLALCALALAEGRLAGGVAALTLERGYRSTQAEVVYLCLQTGPLKQFQPADALCAESHHPGHYSSVSMPHHQGRVMQRRTNNLLRGSSVARKEDQG